jgi:hypothetical protein
VGERKKNRIGMESVFSNYEAATILVKANGLDLTALTSDSRCHIMKVVLIPTAASGH